MDTIDIINVVFMLIALLGLGIHLQERINKMTDGVNTKTNFLATKEDKDSVARRLSQIEDDMEDLKNELILAGADQRWVATGWTDFQKGLMAIKRGIYDGKRVTDA